MGARLGQHFLTSRAALARIVEAAKLRAGETVLEIGPGKGMLTEKLLAAGAKVVAVEKDERLARELEKRFSRETERGELRLITGDIRDLDPERLKLPRDYAVVANIPYYITGAIVRQFLTAKRQPSRMVLLIQKEVAVRIARSKKESLLSLSVKAYGNPRVVDTVPRGAFSPPPKVDSAILRIENISRKKFNDAGVLEETFFELLHRGFGQKRKMLMSNLGNAFPRGDVEKAFLTADLDAKVRAEDVVLKDWLRLVASLR